MSSPEMTQVGMRLRGDVIKALDAYRRDQEIPPSRARAAEILLRHALSQHFYTKEPGALAAGAGICARGGGNPRPCYEIKAISALPLAAAQIRHIAKRGTERCRLRCVRRASAS